MTSMSMPGSGDEIAELRSQIEKLNALVTGQPSAKVRGRSWRRPLALVGVAVLAVGMLAGVAGASGSTTNVSFVPLSPAKVILSNVNIATHKTNSPVVIGGTTTVPSNATTVQLIVTAKGPSIGTLQFYPALNTAGGSGQTLAYPGSNVAVSATIQENVGQAGALTVYNNGIGTATVTAKIIGYSTQVTAGDINGVGGTNGQVLTNDGTGGAAWITPPTPPAPSASNFNGSGGTSGQVLTNNGSGGASWQTPTHPHIVGVSSINGPAGNYPANSGAYLFSGASTSVSVQAGQTVQATVSAALGSSSPSPVTFYFEACYKAPGATTPTLFNIGGYQIVTTVVGARLSYSSSETFQAGTSGTYQVGLCVNTPGAAIDSNDWVNGSVFVFSPS